MTYTDDQLKKITSLGALGYPPQKCINILDIKEEKEFTADFFNRNSPVYKAYRKGVDIADYEMDTKLRELAKSGDMVALKELNQRQAAYKHEIKEQAGLQSFRNSTEEFCPLSIPPPALPSPI